MGTNQWGHFRSSQTAFASQWVRLKCGPLGVNLVGAGGQDNSWRGSPGGGGHVGVLPLGGDRVRARMASTLARTDSVRADGALLVANGNG